MVILRFLTTSTLTLIREIFTTFFSLLQLKFYFFGPSILYTNFNLNPQNSKKMKTRLLISAIAIAFVSFSATVYSQSTATATASATIITPISIAKNTDMSFGNLAVQTATGGTVVLATAGTRTSTSGVTLPAANGTVTAATFTVTGSGSSTYAITLPTTVTLTHSGGVETMSAGSFTSNPSGTGTLSSGTQNIAVGATLTVAAAQLAGVYTSGNFNLTVNYN